MNEFIKASYELEKKKEMAKEIALCCLGINSIGDRRIKEEGKLCVFLDLSGHVGTIDIRLFEKGWARDFDPDMNIRLDKYSKLADFEDCLSFLAALSSDQTMKEEEGKELSGEVNKADVA